MNYKKMSVKRLLEEVFDAGGRYYTTYDPVFRKDQGNICDAITREINRRIREAKKKV